MIEAFTKNETAKEKSGFLILAIGRMLSFFCANCYNLRGGGGIN